jgi:hypothetical protein
MGKYVEIIKTKGYLIRKCDFDFYEFFKLHFPHKFGDSTEENSIDDDLLDGIIESSDYQTFWILFPIDKELLCETKILHGSVYSNDSAIRTPTHCLPHNIDLTFMNDKETIFRNMLNKYAIYSEYIATVFL